MGESKYRKLNVVMYVNTYKRLRWYSAVTGESMIRIIIKALNYSLHHRRDFSKFMEEYLNEMAGEVTTVRTFSVKERPYYKIKELSGIFKHSLSSWVDSAVAFYLDNVGTRK
ncbi:hypothetical protein E3E35_01220 [Thermococcus sp. GR7]|uniref:hypothetical protein n=1 Tax=unclassified Thermococcus TaxID=2627626 RepID=UPI001430AC52|nr:MULTISPECIES: hypothetical protein [unclassified Thermococcus]NJE46050.1 hypothetical protein [Thermococcus sp. GR7]NJE79362.1 hypothetical protein [Thermococcus sp. GR4]NJF22247.1 hypothetical protein [Thermococcus sp. GR5]